ncbi:MAG: hypothetical protein HY238_10980 [Acidobacteria bacterium]|nr:hypothetical protein [Acidobacteriota bacterium]
MRSEGARAATAFRACSISLVFAGVVCGQNGGDGYDRTLSAQEIVARMVEMDRARTAQLADYTSLRRYHLENKRFQKTADMTVKARYRRPGRKEFAVLSESGSGVIRERVFHRMLDAELEAGSEPMRRVTQVTPDNYDFRFTGVDSDRDRRAYVFEISPKVRNKFMVQGRIWLDAEDFAITRIEGRPAKNPSVWVRSTTFVHTYEKRGPFWLAASNASQSESLFLGHTSVVIRYMDYQINPGEH